MKLILTIIIIFSWLDSPQWAKVSYYRGFTIKLRHTTLGRTPLDEWSARRRDLYLTTHNTHDRHPCSRRDSNPQHSQQASGHRNGQLCLELIFNNIRNIS